MGCIVGSLACCVGSAACSLCCKACPSSRSSTTTRIAYSILLFLGTVVACVMLAPGLKDELAKIPGLCAGIYSGPFEVIKAQINDCSKIVGYGAVYRVCFALASFFFLMSVIMIKVKSSKDPRTGIQNGFWLFKILIIVGIAIGAFFIPQGSGFETAWMVIGMIGAFMFILIQLVLLVDFAHAWNESWLGKYEDSQSKIWFAGLLFFSILFYLVSIGLIVIMYVFYASGENCQLHKFFVSFNMILCIAISVLSVLPCIQEVNPKSGLLQSSLLSVYVLYLTWSSMTNNPDRTCNPSLSSIFANILPANSTVAPSMSDNAVPFDYKSVIALVIFIICVLYSSIRNSSHSQLGKLGMSPSGSERAIIDADDNDYGSAGQPDAESGKGQNVWDDEGETVAYSYSLFHLMFMLASLYVMMSLTHWYSPSAGANVLEANEPSMWVKIASSWVCVVLYLWTLVAPLILRNRDFS